MTDPYTTVHDTPFGYVATVAPLTGNVGDGMRFRILNHTCGDGDDRTLELVLTGEMTWHGKTTMRSGLPVFIDSMTDWTDFNAAMAAVLRAAATHCKGWGVESPNYKEPA